MKKEKQNENNKSIGPSNNGRQMVNNFMQDNESRVSEPIVAHRSM